MGKALQVMNGFVQLTCVELAARPTGPEILKVAGHFVETPSLVPVHIGVGSDPVEIRHHPTDQVILVLAIFVSPLPVIRRQI